METTYIYLLLENICFDENSLNFERLYFLMFFLSNKCKCWLFAFAAGFPGSLQHLCTAGLFGQLHMELLAGMSGFLHRWEKFEISGNIVLFPRIKVERVYTKKLPNTWTSIESISDTDNWSNTVDAVV